MPDSAYWDSLPDSTLARLLYRDSVQQKHSKKRRLEEELTEKTGADAAAAQPAERLLPQQFQPLSRVAADFMEQAWQAVVES